MAAPVFAFGVLPASPHPNIFLNLLCCKVFLFKSTQPKGLSGTASGLFLIKSGADCGGVTWSMSNCCATLIVLFSLSLVSKKAVFVLASTSTKL